LCSGAFSPEIRSSDEKDRGLREPSFGFGAEDGSESPERVLSDPGYTADIISFEEGDVKAERGWQSMMVLSALVDCFVRYVMSALESIPKTAGGSFSG
jgi:hypothetical protein